MCCQDRPIWDGAVAAFFRSYRAAFAAHPRVVPLLATSTVRSPRAILAYDKAAAALASSGVPAVRIMEVIRMLECFVIGSALDLAPLEVAWQIPDGIAAPHLAAALDAQGDAKSRAEAAFESGLASLLGGLRAEFTSTSPSDANVTAQPASAL